MISTIWTGTGGSTNGARTGLANLSDRLQAGVFAIYGTDNTWLFAARSEREKLDWIFRIDQSYLSSGGSTEGSGTSSPYPGAYRRDDNDSPNGAY
jgi:kinesin family protein 1